MQKAATLLCEQAAAGDVTAAKALIPWLDQAFGRPQERVQHTTPSTLEELEQMDTAQLEALGAEGRRKRLNGLSVSLPPTRSGTDTAA